VAILDAVSDLRSALNAASDEELVEIFRAFDLTITYDKHEQQLHLAATITPELLPVLCPNESDRPEGRSQINGIAGAGSKPVPATTESPADTGSRIPSAVAHRIEESWDLTARRAIPSASAAPEPPLSRMALDA
jgi:hypothetical protein